ncbi:hypothetical protein Nepgr_030114 [Nepenthes gracilis]|uniref:Uncharacterized protein n=1 Tax=Nepenthes gracilis TaxID=150966 RepID=A0AAD3TFL8_NEPGR|nr:hypothetical protein Nepgr_030114 [Nepenthes gracilis]
MASPAARHRDGVEDKLLRIKMPLNNSVHANPGIEDCHFHQSCYQIDEISCGVTLATNEKLNSVHSRVAVSSDMLKPENLGIQFPGVQDADFGGFLMQTLLMLPG